MNAYLEVTRAPALRFLSVWRPVWFEGTTSRRLPRVTRRRRAVGRVRVCAPPHCIMTESESRRGQYGSSG